jgi:hypothetical protein
MANRRISALLTFKARTAAGGYGSWTWLASALMYGSHLADSFVKKAMILAFFGWQIRRIGKCIKDATQPRFKSRGRPETRGCAHGAGVSQQDAANFHEGELERTAAYCEELFRQPCYLFGLICLFAHCRTGWFSCYKDRSARLRLY